MPWAPFSIWGFFRSLLIDFKYFCILHILTSCHISYKYLLPFGHLSFDSFIVRVWVFFVFFSDHIIVLLVILLNQRIFFSVISFVDFTALLSYLRPGSLQQKLFFIAPPMGAAGATFPQHNYHHSAPSTPAGITCPRSSR